MQLKASSFLILLIGLALILRVIWLDILPVGMTHDELNYIMNAKSLFFTGENIPLTASALFSWGEKNFDVVISELPSILIAPWIGLAPLSQFNARLPYAAISTFSVVLLYLIARQLLGEGIARFSGLLMAFNPWSVHFGRTAFEVNFALVFYLLGIYLLLINKSWRMFFAFPFFLAGFLSYLGAKLLFLPLILIVLTFKYFQTKGSKGYKKLFLLFGGLALVSVLFYYASIQYQPAGSRTSELLIFDTQRLSEIVNQERRQSIPNAGLQLFSNKATIALKRAASIYVEAFSTKFLFVGGETRGAYSFWQHGPFYLIDFPLIMLGLLALFTLKRKIFWLVVGIIAVSPTVSSLDVVEQSYVIRAFPMFPFLTLLAGVGIWYLRSILKYGSLLFSLVAIVYLIFVSNFLHLYFFRYPVYAAEGWFFSERLLSKYIQLTEEDPGVESIYVVTREPKILFEEYLFWSNTYSGKETIKQVNQRMKTKDFSFEKARFQEACPDDSKLGNGHILLADRRFECGQESPGDSLIVSLADAGTIFAIKGGPLCDKLNLRNYYQPQNISDFRIEGMPKEKFCQTWIVRR